MTPIIWADPARQQRFQAWLQSLQTSHGVQPGTVRSAGADAGTRRYLRVDGPAGDSLIVMDAPPESNALRPFIEVGAHMAECGLHVPRVLAADEAQGFLLLDDFGSQTYLQALQQAGPAEADRLMRAAIQALVRWQLKGDAGRLPAFDESFVRRELQLFVDWCVQREFGRSWSTQESAWWEHSCKVLVENIAAQPQLAMHRDFMPRNLMVCPEAPDGPGSPGVLDFQDAVRGPIAYDIASLLRDAFISWDEERELDWAIRYWEQARRAGLPVGDDFGELWRRIEWTGLQRHLKILGLFCRLKHRDAKPAYAEDLPRFFAYASKVATRYIELSPLVRLLESLQGSLVQTGFTLR